MLDTPCILFFPFKNNGRGWPFGKPFSGQPQLLPFRRKITRIPSIPQEHLALGETPNVASRIEGIAEPDTVAISDATYQLVQGYFVCEDLGQHTLKGVDNSQQVYCVVSASGAQSRLDVGVTTGLTPLVGRESEVTLLFERWQQVKEGQENRKLPCSSNAGSRSKRDRAKWYC